MSKSKPKQGASRRTIVIGAVAGVAALGAVVGGLGPTTSAPARAVAVVLHKNPECQCCEGYAEYLREHGFQVTVKPTHDLSMLHRLAAIAPEFEGCHLSMMGDYVVAGHVPIGVIDRLLTEKPAIRGVTLPGMPRGAPGMTGGKEGDWVIYEVGGALDASGRPKVYAVE